MYLGKFKMKTFIIYVVAFFEMCILAAFIAAAAVWSDIAIKEYHTKYSLYDSLRK